MAWVVSMLAACVMGLTAFDCNIHGHHGRALFYAACCFVNIILGILSLEARK